MVHHGLINKLIHNSFERWTKSDLLTKNLAEDVYKHSSLKEQGLDCIRSKNAKGILLEKESTAESRAPADLSSMTTKDDSTIKVEGISHQPGIP